jgi:hypothetical protein
MTTKGNAVRAAEPHRVTWAGLGKAGLVGAELGSIACIADQVLECAIRSGGSA